MPRIIEIMLFLTPFLGLATWRLLFPSPSPPLWLVGGLAGFVLLMLGSLLWMHQQDAADRRQAYVPATLRDGRVLPGHPAAPP
jgi:hypothetical protein